MKKIGSQLRLGTKHGSIQAIKQWGSAPDDCTLTWTRKKTKIKLLDHARRMYPNPKYKLLKIADKFEKGDFSINILFLPVSHPESNPIEMVRSSVKRTVVARNINFQLNAVEELTRRKMDLVISEQFKKFCLQATNEEDKLRNMNWNS